MEYLSGNPGYAPLPGELKKALRQPLAFPEECRKACARLTLPSHHPHYTCPSCLTRVTRKPIKDLKVKAMVLWFGTIQGVEPPPSELTTSNGDELFNVYTLL